ncbi:MAG: alkaline phosphatase [Armatimonadota bacterium]
MFHSSTVRRSTALLAVILFLLSLSCFAGESPRNIILLIGDGMGIGAITAARCAGPGPDGKLAMDTMPVIGLAKTQSAKNLVTDSAAAATALATGVKTTNGSISVDPSGNRLRTILEAAEELGKSTGIVSTKFITDATPAAFVSHVAGRDQREDIAAQMIVSRADVILGGGRKDFVPKTDTGEGRVDDRDLLAEAAKIGFAIVNSRENMLASASDKLIGLFAPDIMQTQSPEPTIREMTLRAISSLCKNDKGFFLMSEGGKIDSCEHANNIAGCVKETLDFDEAVSSVLDFARKRGDTLVIVTADHETGGLAVLDADADNPKLKAGWLWGGHTGNMVPIFAEGPGSELFAGVHDNTEIPRLFAGLWGSKIGM